MVAVLVLLAGCGPSGDPLAAFDAFALALEQGDRAAAYAHTTRASRAILEALSVAEARAGTQALTAGGKGGLRPTRARAVTATPEPLVVHVAVEAAGPAGTSERAEVRMRYEDGAWRLDLIETEALIWRSDWSRSGSVERAPPSWIDDLSVVE